MFRRNKPELSFDDKLIQASSRLEKVELSVAKSQRWTRPIEKALMRPAIAAEGLATLYFAGNAGAEFRHENVSHALGD
jgi:hypothetical protein